MKTLNLRVLAMCGVMLLILSSCKNEKKTESNEPVSQEEPKAKMGERDVMFENDYAKVSKITLAPGESQQTHEGESRVIYALTDYSIDWEEQGENLGTKTWKTGDVHFHEAGEHAATNNGNTSAEWLVFAKKNADLPDCGENTVDNDVSAVAPNFASVLLDNADFKFTEITLQTGESIPMHSGINRIIYSLSDYELAYESDAKGKLNKQFATGDIHWHEACQHALKNSGETEAKFLVIGFKRNNEMEKQ
jgi:hypothetical protein